LANGGLPAGGSCVLTVHVTGTTSGAKTNTTSAVTSTRAEGRDGLGSLASSRRRRLQGIRGGEHR
jgi:hypothetical protein